MGKAIDLGYAKLGERGQSGGAIITGANLRRSSKTKSPEPEAAPKLEEAVEEPPSNPKTSEE